MLIQSCICASNQHLLVRLCAAQANLLTDYNGQCMAAPANNFFVQVLPCSLSHPPDMAASHTV